MKTLYQYIKEASESEDVDNEEKTTERGEIKFTIWEEPDKKVKWLKDNQKFQKIEYKYENKEKNIFIDFLLGYERGSWKLWIGKIGAVGYDDDPYCDFKTKKFAEAIVMALDKVQEFLEDVKEDPENYVQYYKNI